MSHPVYLWLAKKLCKTVWQRFTTLCIYRFRAQELHYDKDDVRMTLFRKFCQGSMANREKTLIERQLSKGTAIAQKAGKRWYLLVRSALWIKCLRLQAFLDFRSFDFHDFWFNAVYVSILFSSSLVLPSNLDLRSFWVCAFFVSPH